MIVVLNRHVYSLKCTNEKMGAMYGHNYIVLVVCVEIQLNVLRQFRSGCMTLCVRMIS